MRVQTCLIPLLLAVLLPGAAHAAPADDSFAGVTDEVNSKLVKIFGAGGYRGVPSYGTGILISADGYILTVASQMLETEDLRIHLPTGERYYAQIVAAEPELDLALLKIKEKVEGLKYFNIIEQAALPLVEPGTGVLAFSNTFNIATRAEPMSVQRGVIAAYSKLRGRRGIFECLTMARSTSSMPSPTIPAPAAEPSPPGMASSSWESSARN